MEISPASSCMGLTLTIFLLIYLDFDVLASGMEANNGILFRNLQKFIDRGKE
jgi:hypothetical protein